MDGAELELAERERTKEAVKKNFKHQIGRRNRAARRGRTSSDEGENNGGTCSGLGYGEGAASSNDGGGSAPAGFPHPLPYEDSSLLMHYLDHVFPLQYPCYKPKGPYGRGWLMWLLSKVGPLYRASLSLASLHLRVIGHESPRGHDVELEYLTRGLRELQDFIGRSAADGMAAQDEVLVEVMACGASLISFEVS